jgi:hypothetical protein
MMSLFEIAKKHIAGKLKNNGQEQYVRMQYEILAFRNGAFIMDKCILPLVQVQMSSGTAKDRLNALLKWESEIVGYLWETHRVKLLALLKVSDRRMNCFLSKKEPLDQLNDYIEAMTEEKTHHRRVFRRQNHSIISRETFMQQCPGGLDPKTWIDIGLATGRIYILPTDPQQKNVVKPAHMMTGLTREIKEGPMRDADGLIIHPQSGYHLTDDDAQRLNTLFMDRLEKEGFCVTYFSWSSTTECRIADICRQLAAPTYWMFRDPKKSIFSNLENAWKTIWFELEDLGKTDKAIYDEIFQKKHLEHQLNTEKRCVNVPVLSSEEIEKKRQLEEQKQKAAKRSREDAIKKMAADKAREDMKRKEAEKKLLGKKKK